MKFIVPIFTRGSQWQSQQNITQREHLATTLYNDTAVEVKRTLLQHQHCSETVSVQEILHETCSVKWLFKSYLCVQGEVDVIVYNRRAVVRIHVLSSALENWPLADQWLHRSFPGLGGPGYRQHQHPSPQKSALTGTFHGPCHLWRTQVYSVETENWIKSSFEDQLRGDIRADVYWRI